MGIDLRLLPCEHWRENDGRPLWGYTHTILELGRVDSETWHAFEALVKPHLLPLPAGHDVSSHVGILIPDGSYKGERAYGTFRDKDAFGEPYKAVAARHLVPWLEAHFSYDGKHGSGPYQFAVLAYVRALPMETKIVLDWY